MIKEIKIRDSGKDDKTKKDYENMMEKLFNRCDMLQKLLNNIPDYIYIKDRKNRFVIVNNTMADFYGIRPEDFIGKTDFDFFSEEHAKQAYEDEQKVIRTRKPIVNLEEKETFKDKEDRWAYTTKMPWHDKNNNIIGIFGISRDISDRKKAEEKIKYLSFHDSLTGLYNRAYFDEELRRLEYCKAASHNHSNGRYKRA